MRAFLLILFLASCSPLGVLSSLSGGPSATAIGTQLGKENTQQIVASQTKQEAGRDIVSKQVEAQTIEKVAITNQQIPAWLLVVGLIGWILPTPYQIAQWILSLFKRNK